VRVRRPVKIIEVRIPQMAGRRRQWQQMGACHGERMNLKARLGALERQSYWEV